MSEPLFYQNPVTVSLTQFGPDYRTFGKDPYGPTINMVTTYTPPTIGPVTIEPDKE